MRNCKFHNPQGRGSCASLAWPYKSSSENGYFFINLLLDSMACFRQTKCIAMITMEVPQKL